MHILEQYDYIKDSDLGKGGQGEVYIYIKDGKQYVIKKFPKNNMVSSSSFTHELHVVQYLRGSGIIPEFVETISDDEYDYIIS